MARRRMLSEEILTDEKFNGLSLESQNLFLRMLALADDCGVVPASEYTLAALTNPPPKVRRNLLGYVNEIVDAGLGRLIVYQNKAFFTFKPESFLAHQGHILNKRTRSEYLRISAIDYDSGNFQELRGKSFSKDENASSIAESSKQKAESSKQKAERQVEFVPPTIEEMKAYSVENGFPESLGERVFKGYAAADWHDSQGKKIRNWKQKMQQVWFKDENRSAKREMTKAEADAELERVYAEQEARRKRIRGEA